MSAGDPMAFEMPKSRHTRSSQHNNQIVDPLPMGNKFDALVAETAKVGP